MSKRKPKSKTKPAPDPAQAVPQSARELILAALERTRPRPWTHYALWKQCEAFASRSMIYEFLKGQRDLHADTLMRIFAVVGLKVAPAGRAPKATLRHRGERINVKAA